MSARLNRVEDWVAVAIASEFRIGRMARAVNVSERTLRRYIQEHFGTSAKRWRDTTRLEIALASLCTGAQVKNTWRDTKFRHREALSAFVKRETGSPPSEFRRAK